MHQAHRLHAWWLGGPPRCLELVDQCPVAAEAAPLRAVHLWIVALATGISVGITLIVISFLCGRFDEKDSVPVTPAAASGAQKTPLLALASGSASQTQDVAVTVAAAAAGPTPISIAGGEPSVEEDDLAYADYVPRARPRK